MRITWKKYSSEKIGGVDEAWWRQNQWIVCPNLYIILVSILVHYSRSLQQSERCEEIICES